MISSKRYIGGSACRSKGGAPACRYVSGIEARRSEKTQKGVTMGRNIDQVIAGLPKERRARISRKARVMAREMIAHADSLSMVRRALRKTQNQLGHDLGLPQNAVSQLESRSDLLLST